MVCKCFMFFLLLLLFSIGCVQLHRISRSHMQQEPKTLTFYLLLRFWLGLCSGKFFVRPLVIFFYAGWWLYIFLVIVYTWWLYILGDCIYSWWLYIFLLIVYIQQSPQAAAGEGGAPAAAEVAKRARGGVWPSLVLLLFGSHPLSDAARARALLHSFICLERWKPASKDLVDMVSVAPPS